MLSIQVSKWGHLVNLCLVHCFSGPSLPRGIRVEPPVPFYGVLVFVQEGSHCPLILAIHECSERKGKGTRRDVSFEATDARFLSSPIPPAGLVQ